MSPLPMECRTNLTPGIWVHWSVVYGSLLQGLLHQFGDMTHLRWRCCDGDVQCSRFASDPSGDENVSRSGVIKVSSEAIAFLQSNTYVGMTAEVKDLIPQAIVAYHNISSMSAGHSMMTKRIKGRIRAEWTHRST